VSVEESNHDVEAVIDHKEQSKYPFALILDVCVLYFTEFNHGWRMENWHSALFIFVMIIISQRENSLSRTPFSSNFSK